MIYSNLITTLFLMFLFASCSVLEVFDKIPELNKKEILNSTQLPPDKIPGIAIVSHYAGKVGYLAKAQENHIAYANKHGYDYFFRDGNISGDNFIDRNADKALYQLGLYWQKITAVKDVLATGKYKWVMWIDADAVFTNTDQKIEDFLKTWAKDTTDFIVAPDNTANREYDRINLGVFLIRNTPWSEKLLKDTTALYPYYKNLKTPEQTAVQDLIYEYAYLNFRGDAIFLPSQKRSYNNELLVPQAKVVPQKALNAFYITSSQNNARWSENDFVAHVAGGKNKTRDLGLLVDCLNTNADKSACRPEILLKPYY